MPLPVRVVCRCTKRAWADVLGALVNPQLGFAPPLKRAADQTPANWATACQSKRSQMASM